MICKLLDTYQIYNYVNTILNWLLYSYCKLNVAFSCRQRTEQAWVFLPVRVTSHITAFMMMLQMKLKVFTNYFFYYVELLALIYTNNTLLGLSKSSVSEWLFDTSGGGFGNYSQPKCKILPPHHAHIEYSFPSDNTLCAYIYCFSFKDTLFLINMFVDGVLQSKSPLLLIKVCYYHPKSSSPCPGICYSNVPSVL